VGHSRGLQSFLGEPQKGSLVADVVRIHKFGIVQLLDNFFPEPEVAHNELDERAVWSHFSPQPVFAAPIFHFHDEAKSYIYDHIFPVKDQ
jgi:hypothetical protein